MKKLIPIFLILLGIGTGLGAGVFLRPTVENLEPAEASSEIEDPGEPTPTRDNDSSEDGEREYVKLSNQFVIPVVEKGEVASLVVMSLSVEVKPGYRDGVFAKEPKIRDSFLQVLFDHANIGGFRGAFTEANNLDVLRAALRDVAIRDIGANVTDVLILEIARQDY